MIKNIDVIFWVEHKDRELESYKEVSKILKDKYNLNSIIMSNFFHSYYLWFYKARIYIFNNLNNNIGWPDGFLWETYGDSVKYISHRWEQNLFPVNYKFRAPKYDFEKRNVNLFCWDNKFKEYLVSHGVEEKNVKVVGNIANNILWNMQDKKNQFRGMFAKEFSLDLDRQWLFMPMNYNWAFITQDAIDHKVRGGYDKEIAKEYNMYSKKSINKFILFIDEISKKYNYEIIIRPHPSITNDEYINLFNKILGCIPENIIINKEYSVREWITASDIIGSSWSTSVFDAFNIGKKAFYFTPYERANWLNTYWLDSVPNIKDIEGFNIFITNKNKLKIIHAEDAGSLEKFADKIYKLLPKNKPQIKKLNIKYAKNLVKYLIKNMLCKYFKCRFIMKWQTYDWFNIIKVSKTK
jgi:surface carbohydrate biosynthesis protein